MPVNYYVQIVQLIAAVLAIVSCPVVGLNLQSTTKLVGTGSSGGGAQGSSVSMSLDGSIVAVGSPQDSSQAGAVWVFTYDSGSGEHKQTAKITQSDVSGTAQFGYAVALSGDGNTLFTGAPGGNAIFVHTRDALTGHWSAVISPFHCADSNATKFGYSIAVSTDSNSVITVAVGAPTTATVGAVYVYQYDGSSLVSLGGSSSTLGPTVTLPFVIPMMFGWSVAVSGDGNRIVVGSPNYIAGTGTAFVFHFVTGAWLQSQYFTPTDNVGAAGMGQSVAISKDATTIAVGGPTDASNVGATWIFHRGSGVSYAEQAKLVAVWSAKGSTTNSVSFGSSVALSQDGNLLVIGSKDDNDTGGIWFSERSGDSWTSPQNKLVGQGSTGTGILQGSSVAMSTSGDTLFVVEGGPGDNSNLGATWVFIAPPTMTPTRAPGSDTPSRSPTSVPTKSPSRTPTKSPSRTPSKSPSRTPSKSPSHSPTKSPTRPTTRSPTKSPTRSPTTSPTPPTTWTPTRSPTKSPTRLKSSSESTRLSFLVAFVSSLLVLLCTRG